MPGRVLQAYPDSKDPVENRVEANKIEVERISLMMNDMQNLQTMDYATASVAVRSPDQLLLAMKSA